MPRIIESIERTVVDENGEIKTQETNFTKRYEGEPNYIKVYVDTILYLKDLPKGYNPILLSFLRRMTFASTNNKSGGQIIYVNSHMKREIAEELEVSLSRVNQALTDLVKGNCLLRIARGTYQANPHLFGKGDWQDIKKIRMNVSFSEDGTSVASEIEKNTKNRETENIY